MPRSREILLPWDSQPQEAVEVLPLGFTDVFSGALIGFNHATGKLETVTPGGSGFSQRGTPWGQSLYTPNGGWADFAIGRDWSGPNTISCFIVLWGMDANYGGLFSKDSSGTSTQFAVGRESTTDYLYSSVDDAVARPVTASSISALVGIPAILTFTHSGVAASYGYIYLNGALVGQTSAVLGTQPTGTGPLGIGRARDSNASFDSDVDWLGFARAPRVMEAAEIQQYFGSPQSFWGLFAPRTIWVPVSAGGANDLIIQEALHSHTADNIGLTLDTFLSVQEALHSHAADNLVLSVTGSTDLTVQETLHSHTADNLALTLDTFLLLQDALHAHAADNITLSTGAVADLVIQEALHAHTADALVLTLDTFLVIQEAAHAHGADNIAFTLDSLLAVQEALHGHLADNLIISIPGSALSDAEFRQMYDWISELHLVHGLRAGSPLTVTPTTRAAGIVDQTIGEVGTTVTVTRI